MKGTLPLREIGERLGRTSAEAGRGRLGMQLGIFLVIGVLLHAGVRRCSSSGCAPTMSPWWANFTALLLTAVVNTAANRRFTFGVRGPRDAVRHQVQGLLIFAAGLAVTSGSLALLHAASTPSRGVEVVVLTAANLAVTVLRFAAMKLWVFARRAEPVP